MSKGQKVTVKNYSQGKRPHSQEYVIARFMRRHWLGSVALVLATLIFFWPIIIRIGTYSLGGDAMFNAWEMSRNQHCILHQGCPDYLNANIFYPNKDTMLYTEEQLSPALVSMPLHWVSQNPIFAYNVMTIVLFFLSGWFMYLLVKYLSGGHEIAAILAGLVFELAPFRMLAVWHLQNLSIFCLPLAFLLIMKYFDTAKRLYLILLAPTLLYAFFASWVQMVFLLIALSLLLCGCALFKITRLRSVMVVGVVIGMCVLASVPLALEYVKFAKVNHAAFSFSDQLIYNSSLIDYVKPYDGTLFGRLYYHLMPGSVRDAYNLDSISYHGFVLYAVGLLVLVFAVLLRKRSVQNRRWFGVMTILSMLGIIGFLISLGPLLKIKGSYEYPSLGAGIPVTIIMPWIFVDKLLPQLSFIRAVGRASVLVLFALCVSLAYVPHVLAELNVRTIWRKATFVGIAVLIVIELLPYKSIPMCKIKQCYNLNIPSVYRYIAAHKEVDDFAVLRGSDTYPGAPWVFARTEDVLWAGYHNRNLFNGYSGYTPPKYTQEYIDFINFTPSVIPEMRQLHIRYVLIDKELSGPNSAKPNLLHDVSLYFPQVYSDGRYALFKVVGG